LGRGLRESPRSLALQAMIPMPARKEKKPMVVMKSLRPLAGKTTRRMRMAWMTKRASPREPVSGWEVGE